LRIFFLAVESKKIKKIKKAHGMGDASTGKLSSYCWVVLLLHTLMIHNFLPGFSPIKGKYEYR
jgi:ribosomal silencing factor RsfS